VRLAGEAGPRGDVGERRVGVGPWFLGPRFSALDVYISVMTRWRPQRPRFAEHAPTLHAIALAVDRDPRVAAVWATNGFATAG